jgi:hypothetical protein
VRGAAATDFVGGCVGRGSTRVRSFHLGHGIPTARDHRREQGVTGCDGV